MYIYMPYIFFHAYNYNVYFFNFSPECVASILRLAEENDLSVIPLVQSIGHFEVGYFFFKHELAIKFIQHRAYINSFDSFTHIVIFDYCNIFSSFLNMRSLDPYEKFQTIQWLFVLQMRVIYLILNKS